MRVCVCVGGGGGGGGEGVHVHSVTSCSACESSSCPQMHNYKSVIISY